MVFRVVPVLFTGLFLSSCISMWTYKRNGEEVELPTDEASTAQLENCHDMLAPYYENTTLQGPTAAARGENTLFEAAADALCTWHAMEVDAYELDIYVWWLFVITHYEESWNIRAERPEDICMSTSECFTQMKILLVRACGSPQQAGTGFCRSFEDFRHRHHI